MAETDKKKKKKKDEEFELPHYPALYRCILVDARHSSRISMVKDLTASALFQIIIQAYSLQDAIELVAGPEVDACIVGPSITTETAASFLKKAVKKSGSPDCAFVAVISNDEPKNVDELLSKSGAHRVIRRPCSKMMLTDGMVRGVVAANANSPWASIFKQSGHAAIQPSELLFKKREKEDEKGDFGSEYFGESKQLETVMYAAIEKVSLPNLKVIADAIRSGEFRLDPAGRPTHSTLVAVEKVCEEILPENETPDEHTAAFHRFFKALLEQWVVDVVNTDEAQATDTLRAALLQYKEGS